MGLTDDVKTVSRTSVDLLRETSDLVERISRRPDLPQTDSDQILNAINDGHGSTPLAAYVNSNRDKLISWSPGEQVTSANLSEHVAKAIENSVHARGERLDSDEE